MEAGTVTVHGSAAGFAQEIAVGRHRLTGDEPASAGGTDTGPNPYDYLLAALGSCVSITVAMYARRKRWPLEAVTVRLRYSTLGHIECDVEFTGVLDDQQQVRLLEIADKCPVHRTLTSAIHIQTRLTRGDEALIGRLHDVGQKHE
jgi:putative redox protein